VKLARFVASLALALASAARAEAPAPPTVVIDPGHGGADLGARGPAGELEKDVALSVSRKVAARLKERGVRVLLTRSKDVFVPLGERTDLANRAHADLFVSIHVNSAPDRDISGTETYFLSLEASDDEAMRVAVAENDVFAQAGTADDGRDVVGAILGDLIRTEHLRESSELAAAIQRKLAELPAPSRGVKQAPFVVLTGVNMPAALVEIGFVTNAREAARLRQRDRQDAIAKAVAAAIEESILQNRARRLAAGETPAKEIP
jgi:N-acetylmuramoyl-L-alanine amidase